MDAAATRAEKCAVAKLKAANKKAAAKLRCHEKAVMEGKRVASNCLLAADDRFVVAFAKAELKGGCARPAIRRRSRTKWTDSSRACSTR